MKRILYLSLLPLLAFAALAYGADGRLAIPKGVNPPGAAKPAIVKGEFVQVRSCGEPNCERIGRLGRGERVLVLETVRNWVNVHSLDTGTKGWIRTEDLSGMQVPGQAEVTAARLHLRACAERRCESLGWLRRGEIVTVLELADGWAKVRSSDLDATGWASLRYLRLL